MRTFTRTGHPVWVWGLVRQVGGGFERFKVTEPGGLSNLDLDPEAGDVDMGRVQFLFSSQLRDGAVTDTAPPPASGKKR